MRPSILTNTEDSDCGALFNVGSLGSGTVSGGNCKTMLSATIERTVTEDALTTTAEQAGLVERCLIGDGNYRVLADDGILGEGRAAHE